jgi:hypothetical protein
VHKVKENTPFGKYANVAWAEWAERACGVLWAKRSDHTSFLKFCPTGPDRGEKEVGRGWAGKRIREEARPKSRKRVSELKLDGMRWRKGVRHGMALEDGMRWNSEEEAWSTGGNHGKAAAHNMNSTWKQVEESEREDKEEAAHNGKTWSEAKHRKWAAPWHACR